MTHSSSYFADSQNDTASFIEENTCGFPSKDKDDDELEITIFVRFFKGRRHSGMLSHVFFPMITALLPEPIVRFENHQVTTRLFVWNITAAACITPEATVAGT